MIAELRRTETITDDGLMNGRMRDWAREITRQVNFNTIVDGSGSPEGVLTAEPNKFYRDTAVPNLYWKSTGSGDTGWLLVV